MPADPLDAALAGLAREDAAALVRETRAAGRAAAARILEERWRDAYLRAAVSVGAPAEGEAWWVYGVVAAPDAADLPEGLEGVAPGTAVRTIVAGDLAAITSPVPLAEFGDEQLRARLEDLAWLERVARAHAGVLEAVLDVRPVVPLRLCTICLTPERVIELLHGQAVAFGRALEALRGRSEWGVQVFALSPAPTGAGENTDDDPKAYLDRKRRARSRREQAHEKAVTCGRHVHDAVAEIAVAAVTNPPQQREAHGRDADMVLNGAYLIPDQRRDELAPLLEMLQREYGGFAIELTGPWPAYNFVAPEAGALP
jgi:hypothetical protein